MKILEYVIERAEQNRNEFGYEGLYIYVSHGWGAILRIQRVFEDGIMDEYGQIVPIHSLAWIREIHKGKAEEILSSERNYANIHYKEIRHDKKEGNK
jgi:hypothetical protein